MVALRVFCAKFESILAVLVFRHDHCMSEISNVFASGMIEITPIACPLIILSADCEAGTDLHLRYCLLLPT